jgi:hypothetical protein
MSEKSFLKCGCARCGGHIEFPADGIGLTVTCPHCAQPTELGLTVPVSVSARPSRSLKWIVAGLIILAVGVAGVAGALFMAQRLARKSHGADNQSVVFAKAVKNRGPTTNSAGTAAAGGITKPAENSDGFSASEVRIESAPGSTLVYAVGMIKNEMDKPRFGVTVELGLFDAANKRLGGTRDYKDTIEAHGEWAFRALLVQKAVISARISSVREQP